MDGLDEDYYWEKLRAMEQEGQTFLDICKDYQKFELELLYAATPGLRGRNFKYTIGFFTAFSIGRGLISQFIWKEGFLNGFLRPFLVFCSVSAVLLPYSFLKKKHPKSAKAYTLALFALCLLVLAAVILLVLVLLLNFRFHFWF